MSAAATIVLCIAAAFPAGGDLEAKLWRVRTELDVFVPSGEHRDSGVKVAAPLSLAPQVPLAIAVTSDPPGEVKAWSIDADGLVSVDLLPEIGEKHFTLVVVSDVLVSDGIGFDDTAPKTSLAKRAAPKGVEPWLRALPGAHTDDPEVVKAAATLAPKATDVLSLVRAIDELCERRVRSAPTGAQEAGEALRTGSGTELARARLRTALAIAHGVPARILATSPITGGDELSFLGEFHAGEAGWLRFDALHRKAPAFPWPERADLVFTVIDADTPLAANSRPRPFFCRGGLTAGAKGGGSLFVCRELAKQAWSRAQVKQLLPLLVAANEDAKKGARGPYDRIEVLTTPRAMKSKPLAEWAASFQAAIAAPPPDER